MNVTWSSHIFPVSFNSIRTRGGAEAQQQPQQQQQQQQQLQLSRTENLPGDRRGAGQQRRAEVGGGGGMRAAIGKARDALIQVDFKDVEEATNHFAESAVVGRGGFGTVYRGSWRRTPVAIKRIEPVRWREDCKNFRTFSGLFVLAGDTAF